MKTQACPLTLSILRKVRPLAEAQDDLMLALMELVDTASSCNNTRDVLLLRAFYVVECLYHVVLPASSAPRTPRTHLRKNKQLTDSTLDGLAATQQLVTTISTWRFERSRAGMTELLVTLQQLADETELDDYAAALDLNINYGVRALRGQQAARWHNALSCTERAVRDIRPALVPEREVSWEAFGAYLATGLRAALPLDDIFEHARALLSIDLHRVVTPWNRTTSYRD